MGRIIFLLLFLLQFKSSNMTKRLILIRHGVSLWNYYVDKTFISDNEEGFRVAKVRVREERIPSIGDKMAIEPRPRSENNMYYINVHLHSRYFVDFRNIPVSKSREGGFVKIDTFEIWPH